MEIAQLFAVFLMLMLAGVPVATAMLLSSILNVLLFGFPETIVAERMLNAINSFTLLAVPFFILSGVVTVYDGRAWVEAYPGDFMFVPEGGIHGFKNESGREASMLILFAPGAPREDYFETLAEIGKGKRLSEAELADFYLRHDNHWV